MKTTVELVAEVVRAERASAEFKRNEGTAREKLRSVILNGDAKEARRLRDSILDAEAGAAASLDLAGRLKTELATALASEIETEAAEILKTQESMSAAASEGAKKLAELAGLAAAEQEKSLTLRMSPEERVATVLSALIPHVGPWRPNALDSGKDSAQRQELFSVARKLYEKNRPKEPASARVGILDDAVRKLNRGVDREGLGFDPRVRDARRQKPATVKALAEYRASALLAAARENGG